MRFEVFGGVRVRDGTRPVALGGRQPTRLLAALLVDAPRPVARDVLVERLWADEPPATATTALQVHVSRLRRALEPDRVPLGDWALISTSPEGYALRVDRRDVDAARFEDLLDHAERLVEPDPASALEHLDAALALWAGRPWGDLAHETWLAGDAVRLEERQRRAEELWAELEIGFGRHEAALPRLRAAVTAEPLRERRWELLMVALYRCGRQAEALRVFQEARRVLADELGIDPGPGLRDLERSVLVQDPDLEPPMLVPLAHESDATLPTPLTRLIGRDPDINAVRKLLGAARLVTISGTAGCGKTRVAIAVARAAVDDGGRVCFVDLSPALHGGLVGPLVASALGLRESDEHGAAGPLELLRSYLRNRALLLVLDTCEHVAGEVAALAASLLDSCPRLTILTTSRLALGMVGEACHHLAPLPLPPGDASPDEVLASPAVRLFVERAADVDAAELDDPDELLAVSALCRFLDGLPLAIEMAAISTRTLPPSEVLARLDRRMEVQGIDGAIPERHRALRAAIDWTYALLSEPERWAFARLSVVAANITLPSAEALLATDGTGPDVAAGLVHRLAAASLLRPDQRGAPRHYRMLDSTRDYGQERLAEYGELRTARDAQFEYLVALGLSVRMEERLGPNPASVMQLIDVEHDNVRATMVRLLAEDDGARATRLAGAMGRYWEQRGHWAEGKRWITNALALSEGQPTLDRARALVALSEATSTFVGIASTQATLEEAVAILREHDQPMLLGVTLVLLSIAYGWRHDLDAMQRALDEARTIAAALDHPWIDAGLTVFGSLPNVLSGDFAGAYAGLHQGATELLELGDGSYSCRALMFAGTVARLMGDDRAARTDLERSIALARANGLEGTGTHCVVALAQIALDLGDADAELLFWDCIPVLERVGDERCLGVCRRSLGSLAVDDGRIEEGLDLLRESVEGLRGDDSALALALAEIARVHALQGDRETAYRLARSAPALARGAGLPLSTQEAARLETALIACGITNGVDPTGPEPLDVDALVALARGR